MYTPASLAVGAVTGTAPTLDHVSPLLGSRVSAALVVFVLIVLLLLSLLLYLLVLKYLDWIATAR